jgi:hypothetical protein
MARSQLNDNDKQFVIDVGIYDHSRFGVPPMLDYRQEEAEMILDRLLIVEQSDLANQTRKIVSMDMAANNFDTTGHNEVKLKEAIFNAYK